MNCNEWPVSFSRIGYVESLRRWGGHFLLRAQPKIKLSDFSLL